MKKLPLILFIAVLSLMFGCGKTSDPAPSNAGNFGSWTYKGATYKGTFSTWAGNTLESLANNPNSSTLQATFSSNAPAAGNYTISSDPKTSSQVTISMVDSALPAISYISVADKDGTVSVSRSGSATTVTVTKVLLIGFKADATPDSVVVTGTIVK